MSVQGAILGLSSHYECGSEGFVKVVCHNLGLEVKIVLIMELAV